ncbi:MAG: GNAT family N-acetyltransferase [Bacteroidetes bacterium]|jgi:GNAT superfamily N-acetyltransferase|nr:GNAT family N-acetyltransferase [Bacteroidota bacterium]
MQVKEVSTASDIQQTWEVMHLLRPHLVAENYVALVTEMMSQGYKMAYVEDAGKVVSVIGFRHLQFLFNGKHIYIDDLSTLDAYRGKGCGSMLLDYVDDIAKKYGYKTVTLDSGTHRHPAHRLYMKKGFIIRGYHFTKEI